MCGIIMVLRGDNKPAKKMIAKRYQEQKSRGRDGFGYIAIEDGYVKKVNRAENEKDILEQLSKETSQDIIFHHRYPTSTPNYLEATHPIVVKNKQLKHNYYVIKNGVMNNEYELKEKHNKMGFDYTTEYTEKQIIEFPKIKYETETTSFNDSEAFAIELALYLDGKQDAIESDGGLSFIALKTNKHNRVLEVLFGRNGGRPLVLEEAGNGDIMVIKSQGHGKSLTENVLNRINYKTFEHSEIIVDIGKFIEPKTSSMGFKCDRTETSADKLLPQNGYTPSRGYSASLGNDDYDNFVELDKKIEHEFGEYEYTRLESILSDIQEQIIVLESDIEYAKSIVEKSTDEVEIEMWSLQAQDYEEEMLKLQKKQYDIEDGIDELLYDGIETPYADYLTN